MQNFIEIPENFCNSFGKSWVDILNILDCRIFEDTKIVMENNFPFDQIAIFTESQLFRNFQKKFSKMIPNI